MISTDEAIVVEFPLEGWEFQVSAGADCEATSVSAGLVDGSWTIEVTGRAGLHEVALRGEGPEGEVDYNFVVESSEASERGVPAGRLEVLSLVRDLEPAVTVFGVGDDLVAAELAFLDQAGGELVVGLGVTVDGNCTAVLSPPGGTASAFAGLGDPPWRYVLRVTMDDGRRFHRGGWTSDGAITLPPPEELRLVSIDELLPDVEPSPLFVEGPLAETTSE